MSKKGQAFIRLVIFDREGEPTGDDYVAVDTPGQANRAKVLYKRRDPVLKSVNGNLVPGGSRNFDSFVDAAKKRWTLDEIITATRRQIGPAAGKSVKVAA
jgi:hypothetical protein